MRISPLLVSVFPLLAACGEGANSSSAEALGGATTAGASSAMGGSGEPLPSAAGSPASSVDGDASGDPASAGTTAGTGGAPQATGGTTDGDASGDPASAGTTAGTGGAPQATGGSDGQDPSAVGAPSASASAGSGGAPQGSGGSTDGDGGSSGSPGNAGGAGQANLDSLASELDELFLHDPCTQPAQDDTCTHEQLLEEKVTIGGAPDTHYLLTLRIRGLFEPTHLTGGEAPLPEHPYFVVGGAVQATDYSQWQLEVQDPAQTYTLNHYPQTSHTIYSEDFEATIEVTGGSQIVVRVTDANTRQIDNATPGLPDRQQLIPDVTAEFLDGQALRLDVVTVEEVK